METKLEQIAAKAVKQRPKSVVREIRTPRSVGTGGGRPPPVTRCARLLGATRGANSGTRLVPRRLPATEKSLSGLLPDEDGIGQL